MILPQMILASAGLSNKNSANFSFIADSTAVFTSLDTSLSLVWLENLGSGTLTETTAIKPSRASSPDVAALAFFE